MACRKRKTRPVHSRRCSPHDRLLTANHRGVINSAQGAPSSVNISSVDAAPALGDCSLSCENLCRDCGNQLKLAWFNQDRAKLRGQHAAARFREDFLALDAEESVCRCNETVELLNATLAAGCRGM